MFLAVCLSRTHGHGKSPISQHFALTCVLLSDRPRQQNKQTTKRVRNPPPRNRKLITAFDAMTLSSIFCKKICARCRNPLHKWKWPHLMKYIYESVQVSVVRYARKYARGAEGPPLTQVVTVVGCRSSFMRLLECLAAALGASNVGQTSEFRRAPSGHCTDVRTYGAADADYVLPCTI